MRMTRAFERQKGAALLISLIILLALTLLAVSGMQSSIFQERMATSLREGMDALQLADRVLPEVENQLPCRFGAGVDSDNACPSVGFYEKGEAPGSIFSAAESELAEWRRPGASDNDGPSGVWYLVEHLGEFSVTATGGNSHRFGDDYTGGRNVTASLNRARIVVMARGPSGESRRAIESLYIY